MLCYILLYYILFTIIYYIFVFYSILLYYIIYILIICNISIYIVYYFMICYSKHIVYTYIYYNSYYILYVIQYMYARGAKFSDTSCLWVIGNVKNRVFTVVICTFLSIVICLANLMFDARSFFRPFKLKYKMYFSLVPLSLNC